MKVYLVSQTGEQIELGTEYTDTYKIIPDIVGLESPHYNNTTSQTAFTDGQSYYGAYADYRELSLSFLIQCEGYADMWITSKRRDIIRVLNPKNGEITFRLELDDGQTYDIQSIIAGVPTITQSGYKPNNAICNIDLICYDPWFKDHTQGVKEISLSTGGFKLPFVLPLNLGTYGYDIITNNGDVASPCLIVINGPITNPVIENETTGESIIITRELVVGERLMIDTDYKTPYVRYYDTNGEYTDLFNAVDIDSVFFQIQPGDNTIKLTDTEDLTGSTFVFAWYDRYSGV